MEPTLVWQSGPDGQTTPRRAQNVVVVPGANDAVSTVGSGGVGEEPSSTAVASAPQSEEISTEANLVNSALSISRQIAHARLSAILSTANGETENKNN